VTPFHASAAAITFAVVGLGRSSSAQPAIAPALSSASATVVSASTPLVQRNAPAPPSGSGLRSTGKSWLSVIAAPFQKRK